MSAYTVFTGFSYFEFLDWFLLALVPFLAFAWFSLPKRRLATREASYSENSCERTPEKIDLGFGKLIDSFGELLAFLFDGVVSTYIGWIVCIVALLLAMAIFLP